MGTNLVAPFAGRIFNASGRKVLFLLVLGMGCLLVAFFHFLGAPTVWALWAVPTKYSGFGDLIDVLQGIQSATSTSSGLVSGYPGIWGLLGLLGLGTNDTTAIAIILYCAFAAGLFAFARRYDARSALLIGIVIFSPAAMLGYERANLDLAMFAILALALWLDSISTLLPIIPILLAGMLKIYPILALAYLLKHPRAKFLLWGGIAAGIFIVYLVLVGRGAQGMLTEIPKGDLFAYGTGVIAFYLFRMGLPRAQTNLVILLSFAGVYLLALGILFLCYKRGIYELLSGIAAPWLDAFRVGALIYIGTFVAGNSFNYRLLFLVFCIPQLVAWAGQGSPVYREARTTLIALLASCWCAILLWGVPDAVVLGLAQIVNWTLFAGLFYLLVGSLPDWLFGEIRRFFEKYENRSRPRAPAR